MSAIVDPSRPLLSIRHLRVQRQARGLWPWKRAGGRALDDLHLDLRAGETLAVFGEPGSGKSILAHVLAGLQPVEAGSIRYGGADLATLPPESWKPLQREIQMLAEEPAPKARKRLIAGEWTTALLHELYPSLAAPERAASAQAAFERVGLAPADLGKRLHEFPAGALRRIAIARAAILQPKLLIAGEPGRGLDASLQAEIFELLVGLQRQYGFSLLLTSPELAPLRGLDARVLIMYRGRVMEQARAETLFERPMHPYTRARLAFEAGGAQAEVPKEDAHAASGCVYHGGCPLAESLCVRSVPNLRKTGHEHYAACHFVAEPGA